MFRNARIVARQAKTAPKSFSRSLVQVPLLSNVSKDQGIKGLYSPKGLDVAWFQYQSYLVDRLNQLIKDDPTLSSMQSAFQIAEATKSIPELAEINHYASQAYNNEFFFSALKDSVNPDATFGSGNPRKVDISTEIRNSPPMMEPSESNDYYSSSASRSSSSRDALASSMKDSFDSAVSFRELLINRANAIFGNGHAWLVQSAEGSRRSDLFVVNTYNAGTPFPKHDNEAGAAKAGSSGMVMDVNDFTRSPKLIPLLNVSVWQHSYLVDYGVAGKRQYLENLFDCIDWEVVVNRFSREK